MSVAELLVAALLLAGAVLTLIAALGILRFPDVYTRLSAASKAGTLGALLVLAGYGLRFAELGVDARVVAAVVFLVLGTPVAAHVLARAAHGRRGTLWEGTLRDELEEARSPRTGDEPPS